MSAPLPTQILVVRHAEVHNPKNILYGRLPRFGLSAAGRIQADRAGRFLAARPVAALYSSPLLRARQTAAILSQYHPNAPVRRSSALLEARTGYQGSPNSILKKGFSFYEPRHSATDETMQDIFDRMLRFMLRLVRHHAGEAVVAVSHADPIAVLRVGLDGLPLTVDNLHQTVYPGRGSVTQIDLHPDRPLRLSYFNAGNDPST